MGDHQDLNVVELLAGIAERGEKIWLEGGELRYRARRGAAHQPTLHLLQQHKALIAGWLQERENAPRGYPLSEGQQGLWVAWRIAPENSIYHLVTVLRLAPDVEIDALHQAAQALWDHHPMLRTIYPVVEESPIQQVCDGVPVHFVMVDGTAWSQAEIDNWVAAESDRPFDLTHGPLLRFHLLCYQDQGQRAYLLHWNIHHIVTDLYSQEILFDQLRRFYHLFQQNRPAEVSVAADPISLATPATSTYEVLSYWDFVRWEKDTLRDQEAHLADYWTRQLAGEWPLLNLPTTHSPAPPPPGAPRYRPQLFDFDLPESVITALQALTQRLASTLYNGLLAAYQGLLARYTQQERFLINSPTAVRNLPGFEQTIGYLVNPVLLRADVAGNPTFCELLTRTHQVTTEALRHHLYPYPKVRRQLHLQSPATPPGSQPGSQIVGFTFDQFRRSGPSQAATDHGRGLIEEVLVAGQRGMEEDLTLMLWLVDGRLRGRFVYNGLLFDPATIERLAGHYQTLLAGIVANPDQPIRELPLLRPAEREQLLVTWNATAAAYPSELPIHELFAAQAARTPAAVAVVMAAAPMVDEWPSLTYAELNDRANQVAHYLQRLGVGPEVLVGICVERSVEMMVGLLGILKAGGAYVPLDPTYPSDRLAFMLTDSAAPVLLTQTHLLASLPTTTATVVCLDGDWPIIAQQATTNPPSTLQTDNLAYVIYTSGSTGRPKGVQIPHRALTNFLCAMQRTLAIHSQDRLLAVTTLSFDIAGLELYLPLLTGAQVVLVSRAVAVDGERLHRTLMAARATIMQATPATWRLLLAAGWEGEPGAAGEPRLKALCGGEAFPPALAQALLARAGEVWNMYGPTETTIWSTVQQVQAGAPITLGRPIANTQAYIVDGAQQLVPMGVAGELWLGGDGVARGYLNRPDLTAEKFIANPFGPGRLYKTGDLARWLPAPAGGPPTIEYLGRLDYQVKLRGFRIELGEIESVLTQHPAVREAVVVARHEAPGPRLVAYVAPKDHAVALPQSPCDPATLRSYLQTKLPDYMVPHAFVVLDALPLTPNGKIDRKALPAPDQRAQVAPVYVMPQTATERQIAELWQTLLHVNQVGIHDNFFELGGHSLLLIQLQTQLQTNYAYRVAITDLFQYPTVQLLANFLRSQADDQPGDGSAQRHRAPQGPAQAELRLQSRENMQARRRLRQQS